MSAPTSREWLFAPRLMRTIARDTSTDISQVLRTSGPQFRYCLGRTANKPQAKGSGKAEKRLPPEVLKRQTKLDSKRGRQ